MSATPPLPPGFQLEDRGDFDPIKPLLDRGVEITNGYRTRADIERLRRKGYTPADNSAHLDGDSVDLTPGKSGMSLKQLQAFAREQFGQEARVGVHNGTHVHVTLKGWGQAPGTPGTKYSGLPDLPEGFELQQRGAINSQQLRVTGATHDGDTIKLTTGKNGRLFGFDAFELDQKGRNASGELVPLGQQAQNFITSRLSTGGSAYPTGDQTFGRPVVNLSNDPMTDPAHDALRMGYGMAEPKFLKGTPQFAPYMEAERLARINKMGGFQTNAETPEQFRHKDGPWQGAEPSADGKGVATFFDEPTPFQGLRPEIAGELLTMWRDPATKLEDVFAYAKANGFEMPKDETAKRFTKRFEGRAPTDVDYLEPPRLLTDPGDGAFGSFARGLGDPFNALDEMGGVVDAVGGTPGRINVWNAPEGTRFGDILASNIDQNRAILDHDAEAHPYARLGGQITTGVALPMGVASTPLRLGAIGAVEGGVAGFMDGEGDIKSRLPNAAIGTVAGLAGGTALGLAGEHLVAPVVGRVANHFRRAPAVPEGFAGDSPALGPEVLPNAPARAAMADENAGHGLVGPVAPRDLPPIPEGYQLEQAPFGVTRTTIEPLSAEEMAKLADGVNPQDVLPRPASEVGTLEEATKANPGRFQQLEAPDEFRQLGVRLVTTPTGGKVRIRGPLDVTQSLRLMGGLKDEGGELAHMGITNDARRMDFGSNENFLGKLINNESGMSLDDATHRLWEEGYLPEFRERPTPDDLLSILRNEAMGERRFHPDDLGELADYHAAQAERGRVEEAADSGSPIVEDRTHSITLDDLVANTPPTSAYEDAPRLTGKIGNINLDRLDNPGQVAQLIDQISRRVGGFDAAQRGKITHEETAALAQELGITPEQLVKRRAGQALNAEQLYASRALVQRSREAAARLARKAVGGSDEDVAAFRKAWLKHAALEEQVSGATAEAGRALSQFRMLAKAQDAGAVAVRNYLKGAGGKGSIEEAAQAIVDLMEDPAKASHFIRESVKPRWRDKFNELWINSLLSGPRTHVVNFVGNALTTLMSFPELATTAAIGEVTRAPDRALFGEVAARAAGLADSSLDALRAARTAFRTGEPLDDVAKVEAVNHEAIGGRLGRFVRTPTRALTAADEFWKSLLSHAELRQIAYRTAQREGGTADVIKARYQSLVRNPTDAMLNQAKASARYWTFQRELGPVGRAVQQVSNNWIVGKIILPFVRTPSNIIKFAGERSIFGLTMPEVRAALRAGGRARDEALAKITLGSGLSTAAVVAAMDGRLTGSGPTDPRERAALLQSGWQPNSIRIGDRWVSFARFDPVATLLGVAADFAEAGKWATRREADQIALNLAMGIAKNITSKTWLSGLSDTFEVLSDPDRYGKRYVQRLAGSIAVPAIAAQTAQSLDPNLRDARTILDAVQARIPVLSEGVPVRRNVWGDPVSAGDAVGPNVISPFYASAVSKDPLNVEIARLRAPLSMPQRFIFVDRKRVTLTPQQYDAYVQLSGKAAKSYLSDLIKSPDWKAMNDDERREEVKQALSVMRDAARDELKARFPELLGSLSSPTTNDLPPLPKGFELARR